MHERQYLLTRCLRLELRIIALQQQLADMRPNRRTLQHVDREKICALRLGGSSVRRIARATGWSEGTVYNVVSAQPRARAVGQS